MLAVVTPARVRVNRPLFGADGRDVRSWTSVVKLAGPAPLYSGENVPPDVPPAVIVWVAVPAGGRYRTASGPAPPRPSPTVRVRAIAVPVLLSTRVPPITVVLPV